MKSARGRLPLLLLVLTTVLPAACSSGNGGDATPAATISEPTATESPSAVDDAAPEALADLAGRVLTHDFVVTYGFTSTDDSAAPSTMTLTWQASNTRWRLDFSIGGAGKATMISDGDDSVFCQHGAKLCYKMGDVADVGAPIPFLTAALADPDAFASSLAALVGTNVETSTRTIAGVEATCYTGSNDNAELCLSEDPLLLSVTESSIGDDTVIEATNVGGSVKDADFDEPFRIVDIGDLPSLPGE